MKIVLCTGMMRSGSTWSYNVCQQIFKIAAKKNHLPFINASLDDQQLTQFYQQQAHEPGYAVIKIHFPNQDNIKLIQYKKLWNVCTIRHPLDCIASLLSFVEETTDYAINITVNAMNKIDDYYKHGNTAFIYYENMIKDTKSVINRIANYLLEPLDNMSINTIDELTSIAAAKKIVLQLEKASKSTNLSANSHLIDTKTQLHAGHLQGGGVGKWQQQLPIPLQQKLQQQFKIWLRRYNYSEKKQRYYIKQYHLYSHNGKCYSVRYRMGDIVALMICAQYQRLIHHKEIVYEYLDPLQQKLHIDKLFSSCIDDISHEKKKNTDLIYNPAALWVMAPAYFKRHGAKILPILQFDERLYTGPRLNFDELVIFHPLYDVAYNPTRSMNIDFIHQLIAQLIKIVGENLLIPCQDPDKFPQYKQYLFCSDNIYNIIYLCSHCRIYIGGDTGFTHFAATARVPYLLSLYGNKYQQANFLQHDSPTGKTYPFCDISEFINHPAITLPMVDKHKTQHHHFLLKDNQLTPEQQQKLLNIINKITKNN